MADSGVESFGKIVFGGVVGFGLYLLVTGLGLGGRGRGLGESGRGESKPPTMSLPPSLPTPPRPMDETRLSFLMTEPRVFGHPAGFQLRDGAKLDPKIYSTDELIARVQEGGRSDVELRVTGAVIQAPWDDARENIKRAGLTVWVADTASPAHVVGNDRGYYGNRRTW